MNSKIYYIDCYQGENKEGNIGFVKLEDEKIFVMLRGNMQEVGWIVKYMHGIEKDSRHKS